MEDRKNDENNNNNDDNTLDRVMLLDDGEVEFTNQELLSSANIGEGPSSESMDSFIDELLKDTHACTHAHTCNLPGPELSHTHTCFHVHTKLLPPTTEEKSGNNDDSEESDDHRPLKRGKRDGGSNREAVRKYRLKKKARAASLEDEVEKLRTINQQLYKRLQGQAPLEAEIARLKCLLVDIRGRIEGEIGSFPYQRPVKSGDMYHHIANNNFPGSRVIPCGAQCGDQIYCLHATSNGKVGEGTAFQGYNGCAYENSMANLGSAPEDLISSGTANLTTSSGSAGNAKIIRDIYLPTAGIAASVS